jgi:hypothetical protein
MKTSNARRTLAAVTAAFGVVLLALPAQAAIVSFSFTGNDFYVPRPAAASDQAGVYRLLTTFDLAANGYADLVGTNCDFQVSAANGDSVHLANFGAIVTGGNETDVYDTESEPNVETTRLEDADLVLGDEIELYNVMLEDPNGTIGTSVEYTVTVMCETTPETTTTTAGETTTTTVVETTTTTVGPTTSTVGLTTTTTAPETTTTSEVAATSTSTVPPISGSTLPFTGPPVEAAGIAMIAAAMLMLGGGVLTSAREARRD